MMLLTENNWSGMLINSIIGILVVFVVLIILVLLSGLIQNIMIQSSKRKMIKEGKNEAEIVELSADDVAAISMALHLYLDDLHDQESNVITIKRIERRYSPWNSKIYGLNNLYR
jgi:Na+-transporting methylmalonyl-CoA/oxaloacetate decarboxylase gamma subunit